jgi:hypothetical protein
MFSIGDRVIVIIEDDSFKDEVGTIWYTKYYRYSFDYYVKLDTVNVVMGFQKDELTLDTNSRAG